MATSDILKQAVFDARVVQLPARYAVEKGALSVTNAPFRAISASASQQSYQINVPSQNVFCDRAIDWSADCFMTLTVSVGSVSAVVGTPVVRFGEDIALCAFPLHELTQTMTATINDTSVVINTDTVLHEVLRLTDYKKNRLVRHCPTMLDRYAFYSDASNALNNPLSSYFEASASDEVPNGAWNNVRFTTPTGQLLPANYTTTNAVGGSYGFTLAGVPTAVPGATDYVMLTGAGGVPVITATNFGGGNVPALDYPLFIKWHSSEKLVLSPFIFADSCEWETGLFGINNMQLVFNLKSNPQRVFRLDAGGSLPLTGRVYSGIGYNNGVPQGPFANSQINVQFLTPSLDIPLPQKSVVPYTEFPRYITTGQTALIATETQRTIQSQTLVLPQIPDALLIYVKPSDADTASGLQGDFYFPISQISINFDNFSGLLSSHTEEQLYQMSAHNGLEMDYNEWVGEAYGNQGFRVQTVGGFLLIRPGQDFGLQAGQAPSLIGNYTLQFQCRIENRFGSTKTPVLFVIAINSGFFESLAGSSRVIKGVLSEADIISAEPIMEMTRDGLKRIVGNGFFSTLGSMLSKAVDIYTKTKPIVSGIKGVLPEGKMKDILGKVGYGMPAGAGMAGAGMDMGMRGGKKSLSSRLM